MCRWCPRCRGGTPPHDACAKTRRRFPQAAGHRHRSWRGQSSRRRVRTPASRSCACPRAPSPPRRVPTQTFTSVLRTRRRERAKSACVEKARGVGRDEIASNTRHDSISPAPPPRAPPRRRRARLRASENRARSAKDTRRPYSASYPYILRYPSKNRMGFSLNTCEGKLGKHLRRTCILASQDMHYQVLYFRK